MPYIESEMKTAEIEIIKHGENKYKVSVQNIVVAVFFKYENAVQYEQELQELNPFVEFKNKWARD
ncbi:hypothetical protein [Robertmurraya siralis]|uniref:hypothetical protein n=1 Tax=Robertmurraya siralis TaxID=77777 RepID=UPI0010F99DC6|nr:hypothetical protein [Robertmurraya siralis]